MRRSVKRFFFLFDDENVYLALDSQTQKYSTPNNLYYRPGDYDWTRARGGCSKCPPAHRLSALKPAPVVGVTRRDWGTKPPLNRK